MNSQDIGGWKFLFGKFADFAILKLFWSSKLCLHSRYGSKSAWLLSIRGAMQTLLSTWKGAMQTLLRTWSGDIGSGTKK